MKLREGFRPGQEEFSFAARTAYDCWRYVKGEGGRMLWVIYARS